MTPFLRAQRRGHRRGEQHPRAKLTDHDVALIRTLHECHELGYGTLAAKFEVPKSTVRDVCKYHTRSL